MGIRIARRDSTETGLLDGITFSRLAWSGATKDGTPAFGLTYGAIDDARVIMINAIGFGADWQRQKGLMEGIVATFKRR